MVQNSLQEQFVFVPSLIRVSILQVIQTQLHGRRGSRSCNVEYLRSTVWYVSIMVSVYTWFSHRVFSPFNETKPRNWKLVDRKQTVVFFFFLQDFKNMNLIETYFSKTNQCDMRDYTSHNQALHTRGGWQRIFDRPVYPWLTYDYISSYSPRCVSLIIISRKKPRAPQWHILNMHRPDKGFWNSQ